MVTKPTHCWSHVFRSYVVNLIHNTPIYELYMERFALSYEDQEIWIMC